MHVSTSTDITTTYSTNFDLSGLRMHLSLQLIIVYGTANDDTKSHFITTDNYMNKLKMCVLFAVQHQNTANV